MTRTPDSPVGTKQWLQDCIDELYARDSDLLLLAAGEWSVAARLAHIIANRCEGDADPRLRIDCEYNRAGNETKRVDGARRLPDIVVHHRGNNERNLLAIECKHKRRSEQDRADDIRKLLALAATFGYEHFAFIEFGETSATISWGRLTSSKRGVVSSSRTRVTTGR
jgi:Holliday junction resolvase